MIVYLDASIVASVALLEPNWDRVVAELGEHERVIWSDFGRGEVISSIASRTRAQGMGLEGAARTFAALNMLAQDWNSVSIEGRDIAQATDLVAQVTLGLRLPDAIHVAVARRIGATLVTNDRQQFRAAQALGLSCLNPLEPTS